MANREAGEAGLERTADNVLAAVPEPVGDTLTFANKGLVDMAATASGLSAGAAGALERAVTGREQDWNADFGYGFNRVAQNPMLTASEHGSTQHIHNELFGEGDVAQKKSPVSDIPSGNPIAGGGRISSEFGMRIHPVHGDRRMHAGIDIAAPNGTAVSSTADGMVKFAGEQGGYGNMVILDHGNGVETRYAHLSSLSVKAGDVVADGDLVGNVGSTGTSTGNHLHYEVRENGKAINPRRYLSAKNSSE